MSLVSHLYADPVGDSDADIRLPKGGELGQVLGLDTGGFAQGWECVFSRCPSAINGVWEVGAGQCGLSEPPKAVHPPASQGRRTQAGPSLWASTQSAPHAPWPCVVTITIVFILSATPSHSTHRDLFRAHFESNFGPPDSFGVKLRPSTAHPHSPGPMRSHSDSFRANPRPRRTQLAPSRGNAGQTSTDRDLFRAHFESNFDPSDSFGVILRHTLTNRDVGCSMKRQFGSFCEIVAKPRKGEIPLWARKVTVKSNPPKGYPHFLTRYPPGGQK